LTGVELLQKARHPHRTQRLRQRINSGVSQLGKCCLATIDRLYFCVHGLITSAYHFAGFSTWTLIAGVSFAP
jgi:hypothetical protein